MQAIEFETQIDPNGHIHVPREYSEIYGKHARMVLLFSDQAGLKMQQRQPGSAKGKLLVIVDDADHLKDFQEYMP